MSLDDLNKELYNQNSKVIQSRTHEPSEYDPNVSLSKPSPFDEEQKWDQPQKGLSPKQKKIAIIGGSIFGIIILLIAGVFAYEWWQKNAFHQDRVIISFEGPKEADSTQITKYIIHYENNNRVTLKNTLINLTYSENFQPINNTNLKFLSPGSSRIFIGDVKPMSKGTVELQGIFYAPKDFPVSLHGAIQFVPSNGVVELSMESQIGVSITAAPVMLDVIAPQQIVDGYDMEYVIDYKNLDVKRMSDVQIKVDFPQGFKLNNAQPMPSEKESYWYVGNLEANQGGKITARGQLRGDENENKVFVVSLGHVGNDGNFVVFNRQEMNTRVVSPILAIKQKLSNKDDDIISAGEVLNYTITYKNTGSLGLRDAIISAQVTGKILDFSKISVSDGFYDSRTNMITWKASDVPGLATINPQSEGSVRFSVPVKSIIPIDTKLDKNFIVSSIAKIDSPDIPIPNGSDKIIGSDRLDLKLASKILFGAKGYYSDAIIKNSGPLPMKVGSETTFAIHWSVANTSNDLSAAKVVSSLPSGVRWTGKVYPVDEKISYNERTNQIVWEIGNVDAGSGLLNPAREIVFQVGVTPQPNQVGSPLTLTNQTVFTAKDSFVNKDLTAQTEAKDTQLYEDPVVGYANSKVMAE